MNHNGKKRRLMLASTVREIYGHFDEAIAHEPNRDAVTCSRRCNACCRMLVATSYPEALAIVVRYPKVVDAAKEALRADLEAFRVIARGHLEPGKPRRLSTHTREQLCHDWWALQRPCPFLTPEGDCGVYEARPLACRGYHSADNPERCGKVPSPDDVKLWLPQQSTVHALKQIEEAIRHYLDEEMIAGVLADLVLLARAQLRE